jgi:hypothetical protein
MGTDGPGPDPDQVPWWLEDGEALHAAHPRSFFIPPREHRADVRRGEAVRLSFASGPRPKRGAEPEASEQLWVETLEVLRDGTYRGRVDDDVRVVAGLKDGTELTFGPEHIVALAYAPEELGYDPEAWAIIDARITEEDEPPLALTFAEPNDDTGGGERHWFAALDQQPPEESAWAQLGELADRWPELTVVFQAGGGMWRREKSGGTNRRVCAGRCPPAARAP